ncbi:hypothetical protein CDL12_30247 [Handroanthus impetiginosus]|uniref:Uncharacterized protein n=1 Tax=Handroanthus impetiginosus TaxID=429701 RepID=A0A2G9FWL9_9LAMI|nr:hypothetical protein CDL12_30247 [Handroanthus impetiginosus]
MVRGKNINFSARTINSLFRTPSIDTPGEVQEFLEDNPRWTPFATSFVGRTHRCNGRSHHHPSLITKLCARAGLERQPGDELLQPDSMIRADRQPPRQAEALVQPRPRQPPPVPGLEAQVDRLTDEVHQLQLQQQQHFSYQQQWWALWAYQMNIPMSSCPHYPPNEPAEPPPDMGDD